MFNCWSKNLSLQGHFRFMGLQLCSGMLPRSPHFEDNLFNCCLHDFCTQYAGNFFAELVSKFYLCAEYTTYWIRALGENIIICAKYTPCKVVQIVVLTISRHRQTFCFEEVLRRENMVYLIL